MQAARLPEDPMLPPKASKPAMKNAGIYVAEDVLIRAHAIARSERVKSTNALIGSFLAFAVDLFPLLKPMRSQIQQMADEEGCTYAEAVALLVERGLKHRK